MANASWIIKQRKKRRILTHTVFVNYRYFKVCPTYKRKQGFPECNDQNFDYRNDGFAKNIEFLIFFLHD